MKKSPDLASERELAKLSGVDPASVPRILREAGIKPNRTRKVAGREERSYTKTLALKALASAPCIANQKFRQQRDSARAQIINLRESITQGTVLQLADVERAIEKWAQDFLNQLDALPGRLAVDLVTGQRNTAISRDRDTVLQVARRPPPWLAAK